MQYFIETKLNRDEVVVAFLTEMIKKDYKLTKLRAKKERARMVFEDDTYTYEIGLYTGPDESKFEVIVDGPTHKKNPNDVSPLEVDHELTRLLAVVAEQVREAEAPVPRQAAGSAEAPQVSSTLFADKLKPAQSSETSSEEDSKKLALITHQSARFREAFEQLIANLQADETLVADWLATASPEEFEKITREYLSTGTTSIVQDLVLRVMFAPLALHIEGKAPMAMLMRHAVANHAQAVGRSQL